MKYKIPDMGLAVGQLFVILISVLPFNSGDYQTSNCPEDVSQSTSHCLIEYNAQLQLIGIGSINFYSGIDVENIRRICSELQKSLLCAHGIKQKCPDTEHSDIEVVISDVYSVAELCHYPNFFEVYARYQSCYKKLSAESEKCYQNFRIGAEPAMRNMLSGNEDTQQLCRHLDSLIVCIGRNVELQCGSKEAAQLVSTLVKPSVKLSEHCRNETAETTSSPSLTTNKHHSKPTKTAVGASQVSAAPRPSPFTTLCVLLSSLLLSGTRTH